jgi:hypothetical protein
MLARHAPELVADISRNTHIESAIGTHQPRNGRTNTEFPDQV